MRLIPTRLGFDRRKATAFTKLTLILCLILSSAMLPSCQTNRGEIVVIPRTTATTISEEEHAGAEYAARELGLRIRWNAPTRDDDVESQIGLVDRAVQERCKGLILTPDEPMALMVPVERALAAGVPTVVVGSALSLPPQRNLSYIVNVALIVQSPGDLEILSGPPWWSDEHLAMLAAGMLALGFLIHRVSSHAGQRRQLRNVINTIPGYVWSYMPNGDVDFVNDRWLEFTGLSLQSALGENWRSAIHPDDQSRFFADHETARKNGQEWESEVRVHRADGEYRWWLARNVLLRNKVGNITKWYGTGVDIDDRKRTEQALRRSETYLTEAQRLSHTGSWAWILRTGELFWSQEVFRIFEIDPETNATWSQASWSRFLDSVHPEDRARVEQRAKVESTEKDWAVSDIEFRIVLPDGTIKYVHGISYRVADDAGETAEVMGTIVDETERKRADQERERLLQLETHLAHMNRVSMLGELAASLLGLKRTTLIYRLKKLGISRPMRRSTTTMEQNQPRPSSQ